MLMVIFGAGASYDSSPDFPPPRPQGGGSGNFGNPGPPPNPRERWRPPLASSLFLDPHGVFGDIVQEYNKLLPILPRLRRPSNNRSVEEELESWQAEASEDPERKRQLFSVRYYLHDLLLKVTDEWLKATSNVTNYVTLLDQIRHLNAEGEAVLLVTFNYDLLLDQALLSFDYKPQDLDEFLFAHANFRLFKPHGSVNWARYVDAPLLVSPDIRLGIAELIEKADTIKLSNEYRIANPTDTREMFKFERPIVPAIAIPVQTKTEDTFEWPQSHRVALEQSLPSVTKILIIGWQAKEAHFLQMLRDAFRGRGRGVTHLFVVGAHENDARATLEHFAADLGYLPRHNDVASEGFSQFVANQEGEAFLRA